MASVRDIYSGDYLNAEDMPQDGIEIRIQNIRLDDKLKKLVAKLEGEDRELPLNKTNANFLAGQLGDDWSAWPGATIVLGRTMVTFMGKMVPGVRISKAVRSNSQQVKAGGFANPR